MWLAFRLVCYRPVSLSDLGAQSRRRGRVWRKCYWVFGGVRGDCAAGGGCVVRPRGAASPTPYEALHVKAFELPTDWGPAGPLHANGGPAPGLTGMRWQIQGLPIASFPTASPAQATTILTMCVPSRKFALSSPKGCPLIRMNLHRFWFDVNKDQSLKADVGNGHGTMARQCHAGHRHCSMLHIAYSLTLSNRRSCTL
jgi:hypothetical protein